MPIRAIPRYNPLPVETRPDLDDLTAIHRVLAGDRDAFRHIVNRYSPRLIGFCRSRLGSDEEARDAAQDVFVRAFRALGAFRLGQSFPAWLFAIAANRVRSRIGRRVAESAKIERAGTEEVAKASPDAAIEAERSLQAESLRKAVAGLPTEQREVVQFHYFGGLSILEIASSLGIGTEAVKSRLWRSRKALAVILGAADAGSTVGKRNVRNRHEGPEVP